MNKLHILMAAIFGFFGGFFGCMIYYNNVFKIYSETLHNNYVKALDIMKREYEDKELISE